MIDYPNGEWRNKSGQPLKRDIVLEFMRNNPNITKKAVIAKAVGVHRNTVMKYYDEILEELQQKTVNFSSLSGLR
jgi:predicted RNA methylase